jgi:hypothetical protein
MYLTSFWRITWTPRPSLLAEAAVLAFLMVEAAGVELDTVLRIGRFLDTAR